jgi:uncharacterized DUF497 family protein
MIYYEWDELKRLKNLRERELDFRDAWQVYESPVKLEFQQAGREEDGRILALAPIDGRLYAVVYVVREEVVRIISYRKAKHPKETKVYDSKRTDS